VKTAAKHSFRNLKTSPEIIRFAVMVYLRYPLSLRQVEDIVRGRGIDIGSEAIRIDVCEGTS